jgi:uncharacterized oxidoreductase
VPTVTASELTRICVEVLEAAGATGAAARAVAEGLVGANLAGHDSHGVIRLPAYVAAVDDGRVDPRAEPVLERDEGSLLVVDGRRGFGQVVAGYATARVLQRLGEGRPLVAAFAHDGYHAGRIGAYVERMAAAGAVGLAMVNSHGAGRLVAPFGGHQRRLSTNPIAFAAPVAGGPPLVLDMATSVVAEGKVRVRRNRGEPLPENWIVDAGGRPSRRAEDLYDGGALLPLGGPNQGYKGFGLSLMVEVLAGALSGAGCSRPGETWSGNGFFCLGVAPTHPALAEQVAGLIRHVKENQPGVLVPGEPEASRRAEREAHGIELDPETWRQIAEVAARHGVAVA